MGGASLCWPAQGLQAEETTNSSDDECFSSSNSHYAFIFMSATFCLYHAYCPYLGPLSTALILMEVSGKDCHLCSYVS